MCGGVCLRERERVREWLKNDCAHEKGVKEGRVRLRKGGRKREVRRRYEKERGIETLKVCIKLDLFCFEIDQCLVSPPKCNIELPFSFNFSLFRSIVKEKNHQNGLAIYSKYNANNLHLFSICSFQLTERESSIRQFTMLSKN